MDVTVIGGAGRTGRLVVEELRRLGHAPTVLARRAATGGGQVRGSITDPAAVRASTAGADAVVVVVESDDRGDGPNGPRRVHRDGMAHVLDAAPAGAAVVLVSQIYITRPDRLPEVREVIDARREAEAMVRASGRRYAVVRPSWLTDGPSGPVRVEQGDRGHGEVSRASVAAACALAATDPAVGGVTFELYDADGDEHDLAAALRSLRPDA